MIFFFTLVSNYSLYAYNTNDFQGENPDKESWLNSVFHKNDGYQTPIVLHPFRQKGNIDVNNEAELAKQRLISLFVTKDKSENSFRNINGKFAQSLEWNLSATSKLDKAIYNFFDEVKRNLPYTTERSKINIENDSEKFQHFVAFITSNKSFFEKHNNYKKFQSISPVLKNHDSSDFNNFLKEFNQDVNSSISVLNFDQFMRLALVLYHKKTWKEVLVEKYGATIIVPEKIKNLLFEYLTYKSISIIEKYPQYKSFMVNCSFSNFFNDNSSFDILLQDRIEEAIKEILNDKSHVALKVRQCINFLYFNELAKVVESENLTDFTVVFEKCEDTRKEAGIFFDPIDLLPPPIYDTDVVLFCNSEEESKLSNLSSGEKQLVYSVSSILYHIRNINSVEIKPDVKRYQYINLIFEEIELYFHPEFQRQFVKYLLENIAKMDLLSIKSINVCLVTHSPFILSDIPDSNILKLKGGLPITEDRNQTFGENIHELLAHKFFFNNESFMGDFAKNKIDNLIDYLTNKEDTLYIWDECKAIQTISIIGEYILQEQLWALFYENEKFRTKAIEKIERQIRELEMQKKQLEM